MFVMSFKIYPILLGYAGEMPFLWSNYLASNQLTAAPEELFVSKVRSQLHVAIVCRYMQKQSSNYGRVYVLIKTEH